MKVVYNKDELRFDLSVKAIEWLNQQGLPVLANNLTMIEGGYLAEIPRHHPLLVKCVETLGQEANEPYVSDLSIREIEGTKYVVWSDNGNETVYTPEDFAWVEVSDENL